MAAYAQALGLDAVVVDGEVDVPVLVGMAPGVEAVDGVVVEVVVGEEEVVAECVVGLPVGGGAVAACGVEDVAGCGGGGEAADDVGGAGFDVFGEGGDGDEEDEEGLVD